MKDNDKLNWNLGENGEEAEETTVTLTLDDDTTLECIVINIFQAGDKEYIALLPMEGEAAEDGEVYLYRYSEDEDGQPNLENIEDDEEFEIVSDAFDEMLDFSDYAPGEVIDVFDKKPIVRTVDGSLLLDEYECERELESGDVLS